MKQTQSYSFKFFGYSAYEIGEFHDKGVDVAGRGKEECPIYLTRLNITNDTLNQSELENTCNYRQARINARAKSHDCFWFLI